MKVIYLNALVSVPKPEIEKQLSEIQDEEDNDTFDYESLGILPPTKEDGFKTLKQWLYDHGKGRDDGGLANFSVLFTGADMQDLPAGSERKHRRSGRGGRPPAARAGRQYHRWQRPVRDAGVWAGARGTLTRQHAVPPSPYSRPRAPPLLVARNCAP